MASESRSREGPRRGGVTLAVGAAARPIFLGASHEGSWSDEARFAADAADAIAVLHRDLRRGDVVLIKASRGAALERIADALLAAT